MKDKKKLRKEVLNIRKGLSEEEVIRKSKLITEKLISFEGFNNSNFIMAYMDFKNEVMTKFLIDHCLNLGKTVVLPLIDSEDGTKKIFPYELKDREESVKPGTYGILEPVKQFSRKIDPKEIDLVVVPGVAFDVKGGRIGYGAGYYDVFLREVRDDCLKVGIAFDIQVFSSIPKEEHDMLMDAVITESKIYR
ncbi:5-formyltetrahydrofolate cyclo-ligase [Acetivibrio mesophilus]|uniref:5-formyltetrahydrofolate cyclo-ligase n=1 Tax=Acetivibrio mesophilus TaxID=2487273 RepID=A0A4Q0I6P7_9FIRM|nr:5-formyltetrahydrofolate cyclo-ligase [Acetivibrio mesophilus]ODM24929.1 5-formyltetrahydrofolate cyclo-ligase [Clostridium sp. Bc-iso-3]RXE60074.1 5-formyltetrahydrofolate cyclo-ligase [Acetivibrio mesophilus]HHV28703.1 5-formyltetrahydrofolate cyclo-ligase [Clostridium sp.]